MIEPMCPLHTTTPVPWCRACRDYWLRVRAYLRETTPDQPPDGLAWIAALIEPALFDDPVVRAIYLDASDAEKATLGRAAAELYRTFDNVELHRLRAALMLDAADGNAVTRSFAIERVRLIDDVIYERTRATH